MEGLTLLIFFGVIGGSVVSVASLLKRRQHARISKEFETLAQRVANNGKSLQLFEYPEVPIKPDERELTGGSYASHTVSGLGRLSLELIIHYATDFDWPANWPYHQTDAMKYPTVDPQKKWDPTCYRATGIYQERKVVYAHLHVTTGHHQEASDAAGTVLLLKTGLRSNLVLRRELGEGLMRWLDGVGMPFDTRDEETGDRKFDNAMYIKGPFIEWMARLNDDARQRLEGFKGQLIDGYLLVLDPDVDSALTEMSAIADTLELDLPVAEALVRNAITSSHPAIRQRCAELALDHHPSLGATRAMAIEMLQDEDPDLQILAARSAGPKAIDTMLSLINADTSTTAHRVSAIEALGVIGHPTTQIEETFGTLLLHSNGPATATAALKAMGNLKLTPTFESLEKAIEWADDDLAEALAEKMGESRHPRAENALLALLELPSNAAAKAAAAELKRIGTVKAVHPLMQRDNSMMNFELKDTIRTALSAIRRRIGAQETGQLSMANTESEGGLTVSNDPDS